MPTRILQLSVSYLFLASSLALAAPGDVDPTFAYPRPTILEPDSTTAIPLADGFLVIKSRDFATAASNSTLEITRIDEDGRVASTFGSGGTVRIAMPGAVNVSSAAKGLPDGSMLLAGFQRVPGAVPDNVAAIARVDANGRLDTGFGVGGIATFDVPGQVDRVGAIDVLADGRILAGVWSRMQADPYGDCSTDRVSLVRLNPNGTGPEVIYFREKNRFADNGCRNVMTLQVLPDQRFYFGSHVEIVVFDSPESTGWRAVRPLGCCYGPFAFDDRLGAVWSQQFFGGPSLDWERFPFYYGDIPGDAARDLSGELTYTGFPTPRTASLLVPEGDPPSWYLGFSSDGGAAGIAKLRSNGQLDSGWAHGAGFVRIDGTGHLAPPASEGLANDIRMISVRPGGGTLVVATADGVVERRFATSGPAHGRIQFGNGNFSVPEAAGSVQIPVLRTGGTDGAVSVQYTVGPLATDCQVDACATPGEDFVPATGSLDWADGDGSDRVITVQIINDVKHEHVETFSVDLSAPSGGAVIAGYPTLAVDIVDDDPVSSSATDGGNPKSGGSAGGSGGDSHSGGGGAASWPLLALIGAGVLIRRRSDRRGSRRWPLIALTSMVLVSTAPTTQARIGDMDPNYGDGGRFRARDNGSYGVFPPLVDGRLFYLVAGGYQRTDTSGHPDETFGPAGVRAWPGNCNPQAWLRMRDGRLIAAGINPNQPQNQFSLCRFQADGAPDLRFGQGGVSSIDGPASGPDLGYWAVLSLDEQPDGRLLLLVGHSAGVYDDTYDRFALIRALPDGTRDPTFGSDGSVEMNAQTGSAFVVLADGRIRIGSFYLNERGEWTTGAPVESDLPESKLHNWSVAARLPGGGEILMADRANSAGAEPYELVKRRADGTVDTSFGTDGTGISTLSFGEHGLYTLRVSSVSADSRYLYLIGNGGEVGAATAARLLASGPDAGKLDRSFGADGLVDFQQSGYYFQGVQGLADGSAVVYGVDYAFRLLGDNRASPGFVGFRGYACCFSEAGGSAVLRVFRAAGKDGVLHVHYATEAPADDSGNLHFATPGVDYQPVSGELVWEDGDDSDKLITIPIIPDTNTEGTEQIRVSLSLPSPGSWIMGDSTIYAAISDPLPSTPSATPQPGAPPGSSHSGGGGYGGLTLLCLLAAFRRFAASAHTAS